MIRFFKILFFIIIVNAFVASGRMQAATYTAASCNQSDVNAVINGPTHKAVNGDTINIPSGTCTWTSQLVISVGITLIGNGTPNTLPSQFGAGTLNTTINDSAPSSGPMINITGLTYGQTARVSSLIIQPATPTTILYSPIDFIGTCTSSGCPNLRVDNIDFTGWVQGPNGTAVAWMVRTDNAYGVMDHNTIPSYTNSTSILLANVNHSSWLGVGLHGDNSFASADTFGATGESASNIAAAMYFENNSLTTGMLDCDEAPAGDPYSAGGCRIVIRFNQQSWTSPSSIFFTHGTESGGRDRDTRQVEVYGNTANCSASAGCASAVAGMRSGVGRFFGNTLTRTSPGFYSGFISLNDARTFGQPFSPWATCDGNGTWDDNDGTTYYSGTYTGSTGVTTFVDSTLTSALTTIFGLSSWATNAATAGTPYSIVDTTQGFGAEISTSNGSTGVLTFTTTPVCNWGTQAPCTWTNGDTYQIKRATICIDQPGRSGGTLLSGNTPSPSGWPGEVLDPYYEWDDSEPTTGISNPGVIGGTYRLLANRDWYAESPNQPAQTSSSSPFSGATGTGHGALALRPASCTQGVGYWANDQGSWNNSTNTFPDGSTQGELFICTAANTWTLSYTPYTYPHPLIAGGTSGGGGSGGTVYPPTGVTATAK